VTPTPPSTTAEVLSVTDLAKRAGLAYPTAHREVARLVDAGIPSEREVGRTRLIRANGESPLVDPCARSSRSRPARW
jgi:predicted transcriptional regulator